MDFKIEKNIPIPRKTMYKEAKYKFSDMEVGDSVLATTKSEIAAITSSFYYYILSNKLDWKIVRRKVEGGYRVWRIK